MIFRMGKNEPYGRKRRLEDRFGTQYTMINEDVEMEGSINTNDSVLIDGNLKGQINSRGVVWISKDAMIDGNIRANGLIVEGYVHGNVHCTGNAEMRPGARVKGEIGCASLAVSRGCALEGKVRMLEGKLHTYVAKRNMFEKA